MTACNESIDLLQWHMYCWSNHAGLRIAVCTFCYKCSSLQEWSHDLLHWTTSRLDRTADLDSSTASDIRLGLWLGLRLGSPSLLCVRVTSLQASVRYHADAVRCSFDVVQCSKSCDPFKNVSYQQEYKIIRAEPGLEIGNGIGRFFTQPEKIGKSGFFAAGFIGCRFSLAHYLFNSIKEQFVKLALMILLSNFQLFT